MMPVETPAAPAALSPAETTATTPVPSEKPVFRTLSIGEPAPQVRKEAERAPLIDLDQLTGTYVAVALMGVADADITRRVWGRLTAHPRIGRDLSLVGLSLDPVPEDMAPRRPSLFLVQDAPGSVHQAFGALSLSPDRKVARPLLILLDPSLRILAQLPLHEAEAICGLFDRLPPVIAHRGLIAPPPVLIVPRILEPEFCRSLIQYYHTHDSTDSGFMVEVEGKTVGQINYANKKRRDCDIADTGIREGIRQRIERRLLPELERAFNFKATRIERYIVACYDDTGGHFRPHRDNTTKGTAHRRFAVTINLNAEDYQGGDLFFPEYGPQTWRAPTGGAIVFSCSLRHGVDKVTSGRRYATLPFLYDDAAAQIRQRNLQFIDGTRPPEQAPPALEPAPDAAGD